MKHGYHTPLTNWRVRLLLPDGVTFVEVQAHSALEAIEIVQEQRRKRHLPECMMQARPDTYKIRRFFDA